MSVRKGKRRGLDKEIEMVYYHFSDKKNPPTDLGAKQLHHFISSGQEPANPDPYYLDLKEGRKWYFWQQEEMRKSYLTDDWVGWDCIINFDYKNELHILKHLVNWYNKESFEELIKRIQALN